MGRLSKKQLLIELNEKDLKLSKNSPPYKNLSSSIKVVCSEGHEIQTNLKTIRSDRFFCPKCRGEDTYDIKEKVPEEKKDKRIIGIDNATQRFGISLFEGGDLVYYDVLKFSGDIIDRLIKIRDTVDNEIIPNWKPDFVQFEDIQLQGKAFKTYNPLNALTYILEMSFKEHDIDYEKVRSNIWRSHFLINGKKRRQQKERAMNLVAEMYNISVGDDIAEAILIGRYRIEKNKKENIKKLF